jgi:hypothetical protein
MIPTPVLVAAASVREAAIGRAASAARPAAVLVASGRARALRLLAFDTALQASNRRAARAAVVVARADVRASMCVAAPLRTRPAPIRIAPSARDPTPMDVAARGRAHTRRATPRVTVCDDVGRRGGRGRRGSRASLRIRREGDHPRDERRARRSQGEAKNVGVHEHARSAACVPRGRRRATRTIARPGRGARWVELPRAGASRLARDDDGRIRGSFVLSDVPSVPTMLAS